MSHFIRIIERVGRVGVFIGSLAFTGMMLIIVVSVIVRLAGSGVKGSFAMIELLAVIAISPAIIYTQLDDSHINIIFLTQMLSGKLKIILKVIADAISIIIWFLLAWGGLKYALTMLSRHEVNETLHNIPIFPFRLFWIIALFILCLTIVATFFRELNKSKKGQ